MNFPGENEEKGVFTKLSRQGLVKPVLVPPPLLVGLGALKTLLTRAVQPDSTSVCSWVAKVSPSPLFHTVALLSLGSENLARNFSNRSFGCGFFAYSWRLPAYSGASLLTIDKFSFFTYNWSFFAYSFSFLTYNWSFFAYSGKVHLIRA